LAASANAAVVRLPRFIAKRKNGKNVMAYDEQLAIRVRDGFTRRKVRFAEKRMLGGLCFLVDDTMCVGVERGRLMVRLDPDCYERAPQRNGCMPMDFTGQPMRGFVFVHAAGYIVARDLSSRLESALGFNPKAKSSKQRVQRPAAQVKSSKTNL
jgi:hypothetical protein